MKPIEHFPNHPYLVSGCQLISISTSLDLIDTSMLTWKLQSARVTFFPASPIGSTPASPLTLFKSLWGSDPVSFQGAAPANPFVAATAQGLYEDLNVQISAQPIRIDFVINPPAPLLPGTTDEVPTIPNGHEAIVELGRIAAQTPNIVGRSIGRVAIGANIIAVCPSIKVANETIKTILPPKAKIELTDERDFILQMNEQTLEGDAPAVNTIRKWSVERVQIITMVAGPMAGTSISPTNQLFSESIFASLAFDINNAPSDQISEAVQIKILTNAFDHISQQILPMIASK